MTRDRRLKACGTQTASVWEARQEIKRKLFSSVPEMQDVLATEAAGPSINSTLPPTPPMSSHYYRISEIKDGKINLGMWWSERKMTLEQVTLALSFRSQ